MGHSESGFSRAGGADEPERREGPDLDRGAVRATTVSQPQVAVLAKIPTLVIFGDHLTGSPGSAGLWQPRSDGCEQFIHQVNNAGGDATMLFYRTQGLLGNSHMLMPGQEQPGGGDLILDWIDLHVERTRITPGG